MGYFGSIAKQSGLRIGGEKHRVRRIESPTASRQPEPPIDREEIVMISPESKTRPSMIAPPAAPVLSDSPSEASPKILAASPKLTEDISKANTFETAAESPKQRETARVEQPVAKPDIPAPPSIDFGAASTNAPEVLPAPEIVETVFKTENRISENVGPQDITAPPVVQAPEQEKPKNYFERTSEILAGRAAEPAEVQTILLREIQEWIAAGPEPAIDPVAREVLLNEEPIQLFDKAETEKPEPGVIRIGEAARARQSENAAPQNKGIEEQSFELSIGTISVTIEGDEPPRPAAEIKRTETNSRESKTENRPRGSRLSRHYI